ncbi:hypothetical protein HDV57DRAFT_145088 [Trichoderma longibrachiatum]
MPSLSAICSFVDPVFVCLSACLSVYLSALHSLPAGPSSTLARKQASHQRHPVASLASCSQMQCYHHQPFTTRRKRPTEPRPLFTCIYAFTCYT